MKQLFTQLTPNALLWYCNINMVTDKELELIKYVLAGIFATLQVYLTHKYVQKQITNNGKN